MTTDASESGWGATLFRLGAEETPMKVTQGLFNGEETEWSMPIKESVAIYRGMTNLIENLHHPRMVMIKSNSITAVATYTKMGNMFCHI